VRSFHQLFTGSKPWLTIKLRPWGFELFPHFDQLLPLPVQCAKLFFFFRRHAYERQRVAIALHETVQLQTERLGIQPVSLHPLGKLVELLRTDHVAMNPQGSKLPLQRKTKPARFIHRVHFGARAFLLELGRPMQEGLLVESLRRLGVAPAQLARPPRKNPGAHQFQA